MRVQVSETMRMALGAVWAHRFRSGLTILGIVIGITTVVTVSSLLTGLRQGIVTFFEEFGPDNIFVSRVSGDPSSDGLPKERKRRPIRPEYAEMIERMSPSVEQSSVSLFIPSIFRGRPLTAKVPGFETDNVNVAGISLSGFDTQPRELKEGRLYTREEESRGDRVAVIGVNTAEALFPGQSAVGREFILDGAEFRAVGVFAPAKGSFFGENGLDRQVAMPLRTAQMRYPAIDRYFIVCKARPGQRDVALEEIAAALRKIRRSPPGMDDFNVSTPDSIIKRFDALTGMIVLVSIAISGLGLLVGGIGVMNIMLVSVTERTREIGVRKALGARRNDIVYQFLLEAVTLTGVGGLIGIVFSILVTLLVSVLVPALPSAVPAWAVVTGFCVSVAVGLFFGVWPAFQASRMDPVEALRYE
ncbi:MAG: FtsX-like permease family protein [Acidobacteria bacterium]|nr:FtsX-like permease family protein [Acidobacteriota bacterium]